MLGLPHAFCLTNARKEGYQALFTFEFCQIIMDRD